MSQESWGRGTLEWGDFSTPQAPSLRPPPAMPACPAPWPLQITEGSQHQMGRVWAGWQEPCPVGGPTPRAPGLTFQSKQRPERFEVWVLWPGLPAQLFK